MRLYCQQGFSSRIVQALRTRLERTLRMAAEEGHGHGGSSRIRSRSRGRGAEADAANLGPETSTVLDSTGAGMGDVAGPPAGAEVGDGTVPLADGSVPPGGTMPEGTPGDVNAPFPPVPPVITPPGDVNAAEVLAVSTELARKISECSNRLANVSEELAITMEHFTQGRVEMKKGFEELSVQIQNQATCVTTMTSGVSFQAGETTKPLKAFDRWAATGRWALTGNQSVEANIQGVKSEVEKQTKKLETNLSHGFDSIGRHLREMVRLLEERAQNAAVPAAVGGTGTPITPGGISTSGITIPPMAGSLRGSTTPGHAVGDAGTPLTPGTVSAPGTTGPAGTANPGGSTSPGPAPAPAVPPLPAEPVSIFMAFCPEQPNGPRPNTPLPIPTPCQRVGIVTRDAGTGVQRTLSPTAYRPEQTSGITSIWAPQGLGMIRDGNSQFRRIY